MEEQGHAGYAHEIHNAEKSRMPRNDEHLQQVGDTNAT
jgi:hypothetical protein